MPSIFSPSLRIELIGEGEQSGLWGNTTNNNLGGLIEQAIAGRTNLNVTAGDITLTSLNGVVDEARSAVLAVSGTPGATRVLTIPNVKKSYTVINETANIVQVKTTSGTAFNCPPLSQSYISCDGSNAVTGRSITDGANTITSSAAPFTSPAFLGVPTAPTAVPGTNTTQLATTAFAAAAIAAAIPVGVITMWSGSIVSIPSGWRLCDGGGGTPDLRDRFVVGAGSTYAVGATGGFNTITLTTAQMPSHTHTNSVSSVNLDHIHSGTTGTESANHFHGVSGNTGLQSNDHGHSGSTDAQGEHQHVLATAPSENASPRYPWGASGSSGSEKQTSGGVYSAALPLSSSAGTHNHNVSTGGVNANHSHFFSANTGGISANHTHDFSTGGMNANQNHSHTVTINAEGGGAAHENRPPYFALAYIMKV